MAGALAHWGPSYASTYLNPPAPTLVVAQEESSLPAAGVLAQSQRVINSLTITDVIPAQGKFIAADLVEMKLFLYQDGTTTAEFPIASKGRSGTPWETPTGFYSVQTKEETHFSSIGHVYMPYSMQFYGNYFIHGWTHYPDGTPVSASFSGGCIKLTTEDAQEVFEFADIGTRVFVYDSKKTPPQAPLALGALLLPTVAATSYLVADIDTGDVYGEMRARERQPLFSATKLMTALVANEIISFDKNITVSGDTLKNLEGEEASSEVFTIGDLLYPLLMQPGERVAEVLADYWGSKTFVRSMNITAHALGMGSTTYTDPSGASLQNVSTADDVFRLVTYLAQKKSFVLKIVQTSHKTITAEDGSPYDIQNSTTTEAIPVSVLSIPAGGTTRRIAVIVLGSTNQAQDSIALAQWVTSAATHSTLFPQSACVSCTQAPSYRKIEF